MGIISELPVIPNTEINEKSKSDYLVKTLPVTQTIWLVIQLSVRAATGRQSSQIEIIPLALPFVHFITYMLILQKPKDVRTPTILYAVRSPTREEFANIVEWSMDLNQPS
jgi:hypothetical protein